MAEGAENAGMARRVVDRLLRLAVGAVFVYSGAAKLRDPAAFAGSVASFRLLPPGWVPVFAASLPFYEAIAGLWLAIGWRRRAPALALALLCAALLAALVQAWVRGLNPSCGCFGPGSGGAMPLWAEVVRDAALLAASGWLCRSSASR